MVAYGVFFRTENIIVVEARSTLYAVRNAVSRYPPGRFLSLFCPSCAGSAEGRASNVTVLSVLRRISASGFWAGIVLSFRLIPSELTCAYRKIFF